MKKTVLLVSLALCAAPVQAMTVEGFKKAVMNYKQTDDKAQKETNRLEIIRMYDNSLHENRKRLADQALKVLLNTDIAALRAIGGTAAAPSHDELLASELLESLGSGAATAKAAPRQSTQPAQAPTKVIKTQPKTASVAQAPAPAQPVAQQKQTPACVSPAVIQERKGLRAQETAHRTKILAQMREESARTQERAREITRAQIQAQPNRQPSMPQPAQQQFPKLQDAQEDTQRKAAEQVRIQEEQRKAELARINEERQKRAEEAARALEAQKKADAAAQEAARIKAEEARKAAEQLRAAAQEEQSAPALAPVAQQQAQYKPLTQEEKKKLFARRDEALKKLEASRQGNQ